MTIADQLTSIANTKAAIKTAIEAKGQTVGAAAFDQYPAKIAAITGGSSTSPDPWVRPSDWLELPTIGPTESKFAGLLAITNDESNYLALMFFGSYTVDWGDGSAPENILSGTKAQHQYNYSAISDSTLCSRGYKQVIVTVTPQAGHTLTRVNLHQKHSLNPSPLYFAYQWLDIAFGSPSLDLLNTFINSANQAMFDQLEQVKIISTAANSYAASLFSGLSALRSVSLPDIFSPSTCASMFSGCGSLQSVPLFNTANATAFNGMFASCASLYEVPAFNTSSGTTFATMFTGCYTLRSVPALNTSAGTVFNNMFYGCSGLTSIPAIDTSKGTTFAAMFQNCTSLQSAPSLDTSSGTDFSNMFNGCASLKTVPQFNTSKGTAFTGMFQQCVTIKTIPTLDTSKATVIASMFYNCYALLEFPLTNTSLCTNFGNAFYGCKAIRSFPAISFAADTSTALTGTFNSCYNMALFKATGISLTFTVASCRLSTAALNELYTNLPTVTGKTVTVTGNYGAAASDATIATAKGWTVTK